MGNFRCLALETATSHCSVAITDGERVESIRLADSRETSRQLYSVVRELLGRVGLTIGQLDCIAFGCGPGSFTGVRVAAAAAQALAYAQELPVCRVSSLASVAFAAGREGFSGPVAVAIDARMGEAYLGVYDVQEDREPFELLPDRLVAPGNFRIAPGITHALAAGNAWEVWPDMRRNNKLAIIDQRSDLWPDAGSILALAKLKFANGDVLPAAEALPNYVRDQVTQ